MRVGVNGRFLRYPSTGTGQNTLHLLEGLASRERDDDSYVLLGPGPSLELRSPDALRRAATQLSRRPTRSANGERLERLWWEQVASVAAARRQEVDLLHVPYFSAPLLRPCRTIVTIHDVITLILPEYRERLANRVYTALISAAVLRADAVIAVSECSRRDIARVLGIPLDRISVIGNAVDGRYRPIRDERELARLRSRYGLPERFVLYGWGFDSRKNVLRLVSAYALLPEVTRRAFPLVLAGQPQMVDHPLYPDPAPRMEALGIGETVLRIGEVREEDKPALYSAARLFVFPSLYEGFGIPILEAFACGTPVLSSDASSLPEVAGGAARVINAREPAAMAEAMVDLLGDEAALDELRQKGLARARQFSWERVVRQTTDLYHRVAE